MRPIIWVAAVDHWTIHHYRVVARKGAEAFTAEWKARLGCTAAGNTVFCREILSPREPEPQELKLACPGNTTDRTTKSMRVAVNRLTRGLNELASGLNLTVRNSTTHGR